MLLALCLCASTANASVITQTISFPSQTPSDSTIDMTFKKFKTSLGPLESVQIVFNLSMYGGSVTADNDSPTETAVIARIVLIGNLVSGDVTLKNENDEEKWEGIENQVNKKFTLDPTVTEYYDSNGNLVPDLNTVVDVTGAGDSAVYHGPILANAKTITLTDYIGSTYLENYQGIGTYTISAVLQQDSRASGNAGSSHTLMQAFGDVTVIYTYTGVPEPATASLAGVGLLMLIRRRRKA